jgi:hypothetical protein
MSIPLVVKILYIRIFSHIAENGKIMEMNKYQPARSYFTSALYRNLKAIWIKTGQYVYPRVIQ